MLLGLPPSEHHSLHCRKLAWDLRKQLAQGGIQWGRGARTQTPASGLSAVCNCCVELTNSVVLKNVVKKRKCLPTQGICSSAYNLRVTVKTEFWQHTVSNPGHSVVCSGLSETESPVRPGWIRQEEPYVGLFLTSLTLALGPASCRACGASSHCCVIQNGINNREGSVSTELFSFMIPTPGHTSVSPVMSPSQEGGLIHVWP